MQNHSEHVRNTTRNTRGCLIYLAPRLQASDVHCPVTLVSTPDKNISGRQTLSCDCNVCFLHEAGLPQAAAACCVPVLPTENLHTLFSRIWVARYPLCAMGRPPSFTWRCCCMTSTVFQSAQGMACQHATEVFSMLPQTSNHNSFIKISTMSLLQSALEQTMSKLVWWLDFGSILTTFGACSMPCTDRLSKPAQPVQIHSETSSVKSYVTGSGPSQLYNEATKSHGVLRGAS